MWTHSTVATGSCVVGNATYLGVTESMCDEFSGTWTNGNMPLNVLTQDTTPDYNSSEANSDGDLRVYNAIVYRRATPSAQTGVRLLVDTTTFANLGNSRQMQISVLADAVLADKMSNGDATSNTNRSRFQFWNNFQGQNANDFDRPGMRGDNSIAEATKLRQLNANVANGASGSDFFNAVKTTINASGEVQFGDSAKGTLTDENWGVTVDEVGTDGTDSYADFYWNDATIEMTMAVVVTGTIGITIDNTAPTRTFTDSGNPDVNPFWEATDKSTTNDDSGEHEDTDYSALTGVTHTSIGPTHLYTTSDNTIKVIKGRVRIDTRYNILVEEYGAIGSLSPSTTEVQDGADYRIGIKITDNNYTGGIGLIVSGTKNYGGGGHTSKPIGHCLSIAGYFQVDADILGPWNYSSVESGSFINKSPAKIIVNDNLSVPISSKITGGTFDTKALEISGGATVINNSGGRSTLSGDRKNCEVALQNESSIGLSITSPGTSDANATYITYEDSDFDNNEVDIGGYTVGFVSPADGSANGTRLRGLGQGSAINVNGAIGPGVYSEVRNSNFYVLSVQPIKTDFRDTSGNVISGTLLINDTNRNSNLEVTVAGGTNKTSLSTIDDDSQFTYRGGIVDGVISTWVATGGFSAGELVQARGDHDVVLATFSIATVNGVVRARADNNTGIWKKDIRGKTDDITSSDLDVFEYAYYWSYGFGVTILSEKIAAKGEFLYKRFFSAVEEATITKANAVILEASSKGDALTYDADNINLTEELTIGELLAIVTIRKETDTADEDLPSRDTKLINGDGVILNLEATTNNFTSNGAIKVGADGYVGIKHDTTLDASDFVQSDSLILEATAMTNIPTLIKGRFNTGGGNISTTGGKTFNDTSFVNGLSGNWTFTTGGNTFNAIAFDSDLNITGSGDNTLNCPMDSDITLAAGDQTFGSNFEGSGNLTANGDGDYTFDTDSDVSGTDLACDSSGITINVYGKAEEDFSSVGTTGTINFIVPYDIAVEYPSNATTGLLSIRNAATGAVLFTSTSVGTIISNTAGTGRTQVAANTDIVIIFSSKDNSEYVTTRTTNSQATDVIIAVSVNAIPKNSTAPVDGLITASYSTQNNKLSISVDGEDWSKILVSSRKHDTFINEAICTQVKETVAYQELIYNNQSDKFFISSRGATSFVGVSDKCVVTSSIEVDCPYVAAFDGATGEQLADTFNSATGVSTAANAAVESGSVHMNTDPQNPGVDEETKNNIKDTLNRVADVGDKMEGLPGPFKKQPYNSETDYTS